MFSLVPLAMIPKHRVTCALPSVAQKQTEMNQRKQEIGENILNIKNLCFHFQSGS